MASAAVTLLKVFRSNPREDIQRLIRWSAAHSASRAALNRVYSRLPLIHQASFYEYFAKVFCGYAGNFTDGFWTVAFSGKSINIPLRRYWAWLQWDIALSLLGHDVEIKQSYESLLAMRPSPKLILDVGANYGSHSILFLVHGVETISFEPNPNCHIFFRELCALNQVDCRIEPVALGRSPGSVELLFPRGAEWMGTTDSSAKDALASYGELSNLTVTQLVLDDYVEGHSLKPQVIKIDTEGNEPNVLLGSGRTLNRHRPIVIFESLAPTDRDFLFVFFAQQLYKVCNLPFYATAAPQELNLDQFRLNQRTNFVGVPEESLKSWPPRFDS